MLSTHYNNSNIVIYTCDAFVIDANTITRNVSDTFEACISDSNTRNRLLTSFIDSVSNTVEVIKGFFNVHCSKSFFSGAIFNDLLHSDFKALCLKLNISSDTYKALRLSFYTQVIQVSTFIYVHKCTNSNTTDLNRSNRDILLKMLLSVQGCIDYDINKLMEANPSSSRYTERQVLTIEGYHRAMKDRLKEQLTQRYGSEFTKSIWGIELMRSEGYTNINATINIKNEYVLIIRNGYIFTDRHYVYATGFNRKGYCIVATYDQAKDVTLWHFMNKRGEFVFTSTERLGTPAGKGSFMIGGKMSNIYDYIPNY